MADPQKPGYRTTEFWLGLAATLLTALFASGTLTNSTALAIAGIAASVLTALGYTVARSTVKAANASAGKPSPLASGAADLTK